MATKHEHQWSSGTAQKLDLPATWYWIKGCECGAILMDPIPQDMHKLFEKMGEVTVHQRLKSLIPS